MLSKKKLDEIREKKYIKKYEKWQINFLFINKKYQNDI